MKRLRNALGQFFFPGSGAPFWRRVLPYAILGFLTVIAIVSATYAWDYTNSPVFCGTSCHTMPPEYTSYQVSPHARVACVECHIGRGFVGTQVTRKAGDLRHVFYTVFQKYEYPIRAKGMRPARETCERCHFPEKFSDDSLRQIQHFSTDESNSPSNIFLVLKTGGGSSRQGLGRGIHWHIENRILYYAADDRQQEIPYVAVFQPDGSVEQFIDIESGFRLEDIDQSELQEMDCITCHNRITHLVPSPEAAVEQSMLKRLINPDIPLIRLKAVEVLRATYATTEEALAGIGALETFYQDEYPDYYTENTQAVRTAVAAVQEIYSNSVFIEQKSDWDTHPNNIGHQNSPGCFRCHDGKHLSVEQEAIRLECNLCHSIPVVSDQQDFVTSIEISRGPEPQSHLSSNWIAMHRDAFNETCSTCHTVEDAGGTSNTSFCSNSACHGSVFEYAGFNAPALRELIQAQLPPTPTPAPAPTAAPDGETESAAVTYQSTILPILETHCAACHGETAMQGLNVLTYETLMAGSSSGPVIVPGDPDNSLLIQKQSGEQAHFGQFTAQELRTVADWILAGAPEK